MKKLHETKGEIFKVQAEPLRLVTSRVTSAPNVSPLRFRAPERTRPKAKPVNPETVSRVLTASIFLAVFAFGFATGRGDVFHFIGAISAGLAGLVAGFVVAAGVVLRGVGDRRDVA